MVIDIHVHCFPSEVSKKAVSERSKKFRLEPVIDGTISGLKQSMLDAGVDYSVLQPIASRPEQTIKMNRWSAKIKKQGIISFATIHPDYPNWMDEIKWLKTNGFKGVKFHSDCQNYYVDELKMMKLYDAIFDAGLIILFHSGVDRAFQEPFHSTPSRLRKVADSFPGCPLIAAHLGGYRYWEEAEKYLLGRDIYLDTAYSIQELGIEKTEEFIKQHGVERVLFGTDSPWGDQSADISQIKSLNLKQDEIKGILGENAKKLLCLGG